MIIIQMITLVFSQVDSNKIQSRPPTGHLFFNFPLLLKYKTDFPLIIICHNVSRLRSVLSFVAMFLLRFPITYVLMPNALKVAALSPSLKKPDADFKEFSNFRPISNLTLISKIIEKAVAEQLTDHVKAYHLDVMYQSAFKVLHSTEAALLKVQNDILRAVDDNKSVILLLLDLSSAFDTVDHSILLYRLSHHFGIKGNALALFDSYLKSCKQFVHIEDCQSSQCCLAHGVPGGSVLGPLLHLLYTSPIADIINLHNLHYHLYADDSQLYISFKTDCFADLAQAKSSVELCVKDIDWWMTNSMLKLNQEKTELIVISSKFRPKPTISYVSVGDEQILPKSSARNLGVIFDECCNMVEHVNKICKTSYYHLRTFAPIATAHRYCACKFTRHVIHRARALRNKINK